LWKHRFVLGDYTRVMVFPNNVAVTLEAAPSLVEHRCTYCPVQHSSKAWDCKKPGIRRHKLPLPGETAYSPVTGLPTAAYEVVAEEPRARYRRMSYHTVRVHKLGKR